MFNNNHIFTASMYLKQHKIGSFEKKIIKIFKILKDS